MFATLRDRRDIRVVVLRGAGGTFCAGADLKNMEQSRRRAAARWASAIRSRSKTTAHTARFLEMVNTTPQVVVAAVEGYAIAGGFGLACVSDVAICTEDAGFAMSETAIGIVPAQIAPFVVKRIGLTAARRFGVSGARLTGAEACAIGVAHLAVPDAAALDAAVREASNQILKCAPVAVATTKRLMLRAAGPTPLSELLDDAADCFAAAVRSDEGREGTKSFVEKRKPSWAVQVE